MSTKADGIYFNTSPDPVFFEGSLVGGHDYIYINGYSRIPGGFILMENPSEDENAPETFKIAYAALMKKVDEERVETHAHARNRKSQTVTKDDTKTHSPRKGKRDSVSTNEGDQ